jgi:hypothetical protein
VDILPGLLARAQSTDQESVEGRISTRDCALWISALERHPLPQEIAYNEILSLHLETIDSFIIEELMSIARGIV